MKERTTEEIISRLQGRETPVIDFGAMQLAAALPYEDAEPYLREDVTQEEFEEVAPTEGPPSQWAKGQIESYLDFAIEKAENERGLSAMRSVQKMREWVWLLGDQEVYDAFEEADYNPYGLPKLAVVESYIDQV